MVITHWLARNKGHRKMYDIFMWVVDRCNNKNNRAYKKYWWRWIKCEWKNVEDFFRDMKDSYKEHCEKYWEKNTTLDRINWDWNYSKENCRWATCAEQSNNTKSTLKANIDWKIYMTPDIASLTWVAMDTARHRLSNYIKWKIDTIKLFAKKR